MKNNYDETAKVFKVFSDPNRLMIVEMILEGEKCACTLLEDLNISQSTLSHHMKTLCDSGIINCRKEGKWSYYSINKDGCKKTFDFFTKIMESSTDFKCTDEKCNCI